VTRIHLSAFNYWPVSTGLAKTNVLHCHKIQTAYHKFRLYFYANHDFNALFQFSPDE